jgi:putative phosphoribosyl transferase
MVFRDRTEAGRKLAERLRKYVKQSDVLVLGIPRGGVPVAFEVASALEARLDVLLLRKLGVPGEEELAFGAIASGGIRVLDEEIVRLARVSPDDIERVTAKERLELERRERAYRGGLPPLDVKGQTVILVDDGVATGSSMRAGIAGLRQMGPARIVVAVPVASGSARDRLSREADEMVCLDTPEFFYAIGQFYLDFSPVTDQEVTGLLARAAAIPSAGKR